VLSVTVSRLLCGVKQLFVFHWNGTHFVPNSHIRVSHLTDVCTDDTFHALVFIY